MSVTTGVRPLVHLTAEAGWINDPHGVYHLDGTYHLFFQHVPDSLEWQTGIHWGHATSTDLIHWRIEPVALAPGDGDEGCWSGTAAIGEDGRPVLFYTSVSGDDHQLGQVRTARLDASGDNWVKGDHVAEAVDPAARVFRDPMIFRDGDRWRMIVGAGTIDGTAGAEVFSSEDLAAWTYDGVLATRSSRTQHPWTGAAWECPQIVRNAAGDGDDVLVVSIWDDHAPHDVAAATGTYADGRFEARHWRKISAGTCHFAASAFTDADGRSCLIFWLRGIADPDRWSGALSVPYVVSTEDGDVRLAPHPAVTQARVEADGRPGTALDIEWHPGENGTLTLATPGGDVRATVTVSHGSVTVAATAAAPVTTTHASSTLRVIADAQALEVVTDGGLVGMPLEASTDGVIPHGGEDGSIAWWHLA